MRHGQAGTVKVGSVGSGTDTSRCEPSFSRLMCWIATALALTVNSAMLSSSGGDLAGDLLELDDDELRRLEWRKPDDDIHHAEVDVVLRGGLLVTFHEIGVLWGPPLKRSLAEQVVHEGTHV